MGLEKRLTRGVTIQALALHRGPNMQIKRLLDDREVFDGDRLFDAQGLPYTFVMDAAITPVHFITTFN